MWIFYRVRSDKILKNLIRLKFVSTMANMELLLGKILKDTQKIL